MFWSKKSLEEVVELPVSDTIRFEIEVTVKQIRGLNDGIKELEENINERGKG